MIYTSNPSAQYKSYQSEIESSVLAVMRGNNYILGKEVLALEQEFANYIGVSSAIGVANGTDAIEIVLRALNIGPGDEVITVSHTAVATVSAIESSGAIPVLVDIESDFYTLDHTLLDEVLTSKTKAVIAVHLYGQAADLGAISFFCEKYNLFLIEDVSQAHGAKYKGRRLGSIGKVGCFSCYPTKNLGAIGDAGLITTNDNILEEKIRMLREYGWKDRICEIPGRNSRLDEIQAAVLNVKLKYLDLDNQKRIDLAKKYTKFLSKFPLNLPKLRSEGQHVFHQFVIEVDNRQKFIDYLVEKGIQPGIHYPNPIHLQPGYRDRLTLSREMAVVEKVAQKIISLPMYPELSKKDFNKVICAFEDYYQSEYFSNESI